MNIEKAIEILTLYAGGNYSTNREEQIEAMRLGMEALKRIQHSRRLYGITHRKELLAGETEG